MMFIPLRPEKQLALPIHCDDEYVHFNSGWLSRKVSVPLEDVVRVEADRAPSFWHSAYRFVITTRSAKFVVWVPAGWSIGLPKLLELLDKALPGKCVVVGG